MVLVLYGGKEHVVEEGDQQQIWSCLIYARLCFEVVQGLYVVRLWRNIRNDWNHFVRFIRFDVGYGTGIRFWLDQCVVMALSRKDT